MRIRLPGSRRASRRDVTRRVLLEAALNVFGEKGYHGAAVDDIVARAGRSKGAAYFHFPSKAAIFRALVRELAALLVSRVEREIAHEPSAVHKLDTALLAVIEIFTKHRLLARVVLLEVAGAGRAFSSDLLFVRQQFTRVIRANLDEAVAEGIIPPCDTSLVATAWFGAINEVVVHWLHEADSDSLHSRFPALRQLLLRSIGIDSVTISEGEVVAHA